MESEDLSNKNLSISHQLKFGVERLLSKDKVKCDSDEKRHQENLQTLNNGYQSLNVNNNPCYRAAGEFV